MVQLKLINVLIVPNITRGILGFIYKEYTEWRIGTLNSIHPLGCCSDMLCGRWWHLQRFMGQWESVSCMSLYFKGNVTVPSLRACWFQAIPGNVPHTSNRCNRSSSQQGEFYACLYPVSHLSLIRSAHTPLNFPWKYPYYFLMKIKINFQHSCCIFGLIPLFYCH